MTASILHVTVHADMKCFDVYTKKIRHSQPPFTAKSLRDAATGYAEMACKGHNATSMHMLGC